MILFVSGDRWLHADGVTSPFPELEQPAIVIWQSASASSGVHSFEGNARHAAALIERQLKLEGAMEGDIKVIVDHIEQVQGRCTALYTAVPTAEWQRMLTWAVAQDHHCLLYTVTSLLWRATSADSSANTGVAFQDDSRFTFVGRFNGKPVHMHTLSLGSGGGEAAFALASLGERVGLELSANAVGAHAAPAFAWYHAPADGQFDLTDTPQMHDVFAKASGLALSHAPAADSLWQLAQHASPMRSLNPPADGWMALASTALAACVAICVLGTIGFTAVGATRLMASLQLSQQTHALQQARPAAAGNVSTQQDTTAAARLESQLAFIESLQLANGAGSLPSLLSAVKAASGVDMKILGLRTEERPAARDAGVRVPGRDAATSMSSATSSAATNVIVEGMLSDSTAGTGSTAIASFVRTLREQGYIAEAMDAPAAPGASSGLFAYRIKRAPLAEEARP